MTNETEKKEPKVEKESAYVTKADLDAELNRFAKAVAEYVRSYVASYVQSLEIRPRSEHAEYRERRKDTEAHYALNELKALLGTDAIELQGKSPLIQEAAMLCILMEYRGEPVTRTFIQHIYGINEVSLRRHIKMLKNLMEKNKLKLSIHYFAPETAP